MDFWCKQFTARAYCLFLENAIAEGSTLLTTALLPVYVSGVLTAFKEVCAQEDPCVVLGAEPVLASN